MAKSKYDKELEKAYSELKEINKERNRDRNDLLSFFLGLLMFGGGLFMVLQNIQVTTNWHATFYRIGTWSMPNGLIMLPVLIGIVMLFMMDKKLFGWIVTVLGIIFILLTVIMNTGISWQRSSAFAFVMMFGLVAAGGGLMLKALFRR